MCPSKKALIRERATLREMTSSRMCFKPIPVLIQELNRQLQGWANYFGQGYLRKAFRRINSYVRCRLTVHLQRRSRRSFRKPEGESYYVHLNRMGLVTL